MPNLDKFGWTIRDHLKQEDFGIRQNPQPIASNTFDRWQDMMINRRIEKKWWQIFKSSEEPLVLLTQEDWTTVSILPRMQISQSSLKATIGVIKACEELNIPWEFHPSMTNTLTREWEDAINVDEGCYGVGE
jgi:hypothetical protein